MGKKDVHMVRYYTLILVKKLKNIELFTREGKELNGKDKL
jgi:hypothetical protein